MTIRNLDRLLQPRSVALIGATPKPGHVGNVVLRNLSAGGYTGRLMLVNPHHAEIDGLPENRFSRLLVKGPLMQAPRAVAETHAAERDPGDRNTVRPERLCWHSGCCGCHAFRYGGGQGDTCRRCANYQA